MRIRLVLLTFLMCACALLAQSAPASVQAFGTATITVNPPEQAQLTIGVVTQGITADEASQQNATVSTAVQSAIASVLHSNGTVQTVNYSVSPRYSNSPNPSIIGYTASNTVLVTTYDLSIIGKLIDTATQAGANNVGGVSFGLRNPDPYVLQALGQASKQALSHAAAIASGLGAKTGPVLSAQEGASYSPILTGAPTAGTASTPIQTTGVTVTATVTVVVQLVAQ
ncbi:MAG: SIMPL domain-containing protein [Acidobacteriia bacterium]|nr:SIMPL domain-containing protein [Terriglobia bacterium]